MRASSVSQSEGYSPPDFFDLLQKGEKARLLTGRARQIGVEAKRLLAEPGFSGKVLAAFSTTAYLIGRDGQILWIAQEGLPAHRRSILASFHPAILCPGQCFSVQSSCLRINREVSIGLLKATDWETSAVGPEEAEPLGKINARVQGLLATLPCLGMGEGLGAVIPLISAFFKRCDLPTFLLNSLAAQAFPALLGLMEACRRQDTAQATRIGRELVGFGPGLTPSGDDFLGGLLFTAYALRKAYPGDIHWETQPVANLVAWAETQTNPISHALLSDLASGHGPEPLHQMITSLLTGRNLDDLMAGASRLCQIGHTSGGDMLAGVFTGLLLIAGKGHDAPWPAMA